MNQFEQFREQCAKVAEKEPRFSMEFNNLQDRIAEKIRALPLPEVTQELKLSHEQEDQMFIEIEESARNSYRRATSGVRGQQITRYSSPETHYILAAIEWERKRTGQFVDAEALRKENDELLQELEEYKESFNNWMDKTEWIQETVVPKELEMHRADILRERIESLNKENKELKKMVSRNMPLMVNETLKAENEILSAKLDNLKNIISSDAYVISFQSIGQYRSALLKEINK